MESLYLLCYIKTKMDETGRSVMTIEIIQAREKGGLNEAEKKC